MTLETLTIELAILGAHLSASDWQSYLIIVETLMATGLSPDVIYSTAEAYIKTREEVYSLPS